MFAGPPVLPIPAMSPYSGSITHRVHRTTKGLPHRVSTTRKGWPPVTLSICLHRITPLPCRGFRVGTDRKAFSAGEPRTLAARVTWVRDDAEYWWRFGRGWALKKMPGATRQRAGKITPFAQSETEIRALAGRPVRAAASTGRRRKTEFLYNSTFTLSSFTTSQE